MRGEIDLAVAQDIVDLGTAGLDDPDTETLVIDLAEVTFIDSTGIGALIRLRNLAEKQHKHLRVAHIPAPVERLLQLTGLDRIFDEESAEPGIA